MRLNYAILARRDLSSIWSHIAQDSIGSADTMLVRLDDACHDLLQLPDRGRPGRMSGTRELVAVRPYIIVYAVKANVIEVLRIHHAAQDR